MKALFVNKTVMNKETCRAFMALTWSKNAGFLRYFLIAVAIVSAGYAVAQLVLFGTAVLWYAIGLFVMAAAALLLGQWGYFLRLGRYTANQQRVWKAETLTKEVFFYEDKFVQKSKLGELAFSYDEVSGVRRGNKVMVILMGSGALLISEEGFTIGDLANFCQFISEKSKIKINAKIARKRK